MLDMAEILHVAVKSEPFPHIVPVNFGYEWCGNEPGLAEVWHMELCGVDKTQFTTCDETVFRKAKNTEAEVIKRLYRAVVGTPFCTWNQLYPGETEIAEDLAYGSLYVLEKDKELIGAISIVPENELDDFGCWKIRENAREFARVVIRPDQQHKGLSVCLIEGIIQELQPQGAAAIHIAVVKENIPAQKLYHKTGFCFCGEADLYGHSFFLCERIL